MVKRLLYIYKCAMPESTWNGDYYEQMYPFIIASISFWWSKLDFGLFFLYFKIISSSWVDFRKHYYLVYKLFSLYYFNYIVLTWI